MVLPKFRHWIKIKNGKDANSLLTTALNARAVFTSRTEDDAKIDLITAFSHTWINNDVQVIATQIKSDVSFCSAEKEMVGF